MYRISVPINNATVTEETRELYLSLLKKSGASRVFLTHTRFFTSPEEEKREIASLKQNVSYFHENGIEAAIWIGNSIGHGGALVGCPTQKTDYVPLVNLMGQAIEDTRCPLDPDFQKAFGQYLAALVKTGAKTILIDDDFRLNQHKPELCCACELHMAHIRKLCGEHIERESLKELVFTQKTNKYRRAWLKAQGDSLRELAYAARRAVDEVDPSVRLALCSAHSPWDMDGCSPLELTKILAGKNPPLLRLHGAPYWVSLTNKPFAQVLEISRMLGSFVKTESVELMAEGDVYPRPRYVVPASYLELFDAVIRADGSHHGILKYMADYESHPLYDTGYFDRHVRNLPRLQALTRWFEESTPTGVRVLSRPNYMAEADFSISTPSDVSPMPVAGWMLQACSIPTVYGAEGICNAIFGEEGRYCTENELSSGTILDAVSAMILTERGIDVGLRGGEFYRATVSKLFATPNAPVPIWDGDARFLRPTLCENALPVLRATVNGNEEIFAYRYENDVGHRFLVYLFEGASLPRTTCLLKNFLQQSVLTEQIEWLSGKSVPVLCPKNPSLYILCGKKDNGAMVVGLFNASVDSILEPTVTLSESYTKIRFLDSDGSLDGNKVTLNHPVPAMDFVAFEVMR